jgi:hypothetical protein
MGTGLFGYTKGEDRISEISAMDENWLQIGDDRQS